MKLDFCRSQVFELVQGLHRIGIVHGDLEPRNIARARGGGFCLIDFSESREHKCNKSKVRYMTTLLLLVNWALKLLRPLYQMCYELRNLRKCLEERQPLSS